MRCPSCGEENAERARFCSSCGAPLGEAPASAGEERKVVSALFVDLVGFTARSDRADPEDVPDLGGRLLHIWPSYAAYAVTFFTIGIVWVNHHTVMSQIDRADRVFLFLNIGFLMLVAFAPFPTRLIAEHIRGKGLGRRRSPTASRWFSWRSCSTRCGSMPQSERGCSVRTTTPRS